MKKLLFITALMAGVAGIVFGADAPSPYFTGDGGSGISLAVLVPEGRGLAADQNYLPTLVQGVFVSDFAKFSNIQVLDRQNLEKVLLETESGIYKDADFVKLGEIKIGYAMTGSITKTSSGYALQMQVVPTSTGANAVTRASYSANCTVAELDGFSAIRKASSELLTKLGVNLTSAGRTELLGAAPQNTVNAQTALAKGISAQRGGTEVAALSYYYQAADIDPSLLEAASRASVLSANVTSGNIGADARGDIQWRKDWIARLSATEEYFDSFFKTSSLPYTLFYWTDIEQGKINYETETLPLSIEANLQRSQIWVDSVRKALQTVYDGLNATKRKEDWGLAQWPVKRVTVLNPFIANSKNFSVTAELLDDKDRVIGKQTFNVKGEWSFNFSNGINIVSPQNVFATVMFNDVKADDITDKLTIRIASVNGIDAPTAAQKGVLQIQALSKSDWDPNNSNSVLPVFNDNEIRARLVYPPEAQRQGIEGTVYVGLYIDSSGMVNRVDILKEDPPGRGFGVAAKKAFMGLRGKPAELSGKPLAVRYRYPVRFKINTGG
jgi:TonB family protein